MVVKQNRFGKFQTNLILLVLSMLIAGLLQLAAAQSRPANPDSALQIILAELQGTPLSLQDAIQYGLKNSTTVREAEAVYLAARGTVRREKGYFDPELFFGLDYLDQQEPTASFFSGAPVLFTKQTIARGGLRLDLPIGTELEASLNTVSLKTNSAFAFLNPQYNAFGNISLRQPLLGGFRASSRKELTSAERSLEAAQSRYDQAMLGNSAEVERRYWDLYAAERDYAVQKLTRDRGDAFLNETELRAKTGLIGPSQVANARTFLAQQELLLLDREEDLDRVSDEFASLIGVRPEPGMPRFVTADSPPVDYPLEPVDVLVEKALQNNFELQAAKKDAESIRTLAKAAKWEALPSVDVLGSLGGNGLSGTAQDVIFQNDTLRSIRGGDLGNAVSQAARRDFPTWSVGVEISIPIGFRSGLGEKDRLEAQVIQAEQLYIAEARLLEEQVRTSYRELYHGKRRLQVAREGVDAAQEQVRIGLIDFYNGRSTAFELVRLGEDFAVAQQRYSEALVRTAQAAATLRQLTSGDYPAATSN